MLVAAAHFALFGVARRVLAAKRLARLQLLPQSGSARVQRVVRGAGAVALCRRSEWHHCGERRLVLAVVPRVLPQHDRLHPVPDRHVPAVDVDGLRDADAVAGAQRLLPALDLQRLRGASAGHVSTAAFVRRDRGGGEPGVRPAHVHAVPQDLRLLQEQGEQDPARQDVSEQAAPRTGLSPRPTNESAAGALHVHLQAEACGDPRAQHRRGVVVDGAIECVHPRQYRGADSALRRGDHYECDGDCALVAHAAVDGGDAAARVAGH
mmetsp:Transcript_17686/g.27845  ORF Transcript_17686/g.27845 Transcript_17686/m.27845 type:complete len:265 (-) Transcript_17686:904-1698(-)